MSLRSRSHVKAKVYIYIDDACIIGIPYRLYRAYMLWLSRVCDCAYYTQRTPHTGETYLLINRQKSIFGKYNKIIIFNKSR